MSFSSVEAAATNDIFFSSFVSSQFVFFFLFLFFSSFFIQVLFLFVKGRSGSGCLDVFSRFCLVFLARVSFLLFRERERAEQRGRRVAARREI